MFGNQILMLQYT